RTTVPATRPQRRKTAASFAHEASTLSSFRQPQAITHAVNSMNQLGSAADGNLLSQAIDVNLNQIGFAVEVGIPHMLDDFAAGCHIRSARQEKFKQGKLLGGQRNRLLRTRDPAVMAVE